MTDKGYICLFVVEIDTRTHHKPLQIEPKVTSYTAHLLLSDFSCHFLPTVLGNFSLQPAGISALLVWIPNLDPQLVTF